MVWGEEGKRKKVGKEKEVSFRPLVFRVGSFPYG